MSDKRTIHVQTRFYTRKVPFWKVSKVREFQLPAEVPLVNRAYGSDPQDPSNFAGQPEPNTATQQLIAELNKLREAKEITSYSFSRGRVSVRRKKWSKRAERMIIDVISEVSGVDEFDIVRHK